MSNHPSSTILNETFAEFSRQSPKEFQRKLYEHYEKCKLEFFPDTALPTPIIELTPPSSAKAWGEFLPQSQSGIQSKINLRPTILTGEHPKVSGLEEHAFGRQLLMYDILVQQMLRMFCVEVLKEPENSFHGHGPRFRDECNRVGQILGLFRVRTGKKRGQDKDRPSCANWPYIVRPEGYFQGAWPIQVLNEPNTRRRPNTVHDTTEETIEFNFRVAPNQLSWMNEDLSDLFKLDEKLAAFLSSGQPLNPEDKAQLVSIQMNLSRRFQKIKDEIILQRNEFKADFKNKGIELEYS